MTPEGLPRLLVVSDVPVESSVAGMLLLYRMLSRYPADRLFVVSTPSPTPLQAANRIPCAGHRDLAYRIPRIIFNRFNPLWPMIASRYVRRFLSEIASATAEFRPTAILSVAHGYLWFVAQALADRLDIPLHLVLHDDWPSHQTHCQFGRPIARWITHRGNQMVFGRALRQATTRLAISPGMAERYRKIYRVESDVVYPLRGDDSPDPQVRVRPGKSTPIVAFAGTIYYPATQDALRSLADILARMGGRLDLYTWATDDQLKGWRLDRPNVRLVGFFPAREMAERVSATATLLFLPTSFDPVDRVEVSTLFPSKLADYTAIGLPILIWGPPDSSAAVWATQNPGAAELVIDSNPESLRPPLLRLCEFEHASTVAARGVAAGLRDFDGESIRTRFYSLLVRGDRNL